jgi:hypothetical protein
MGDGGGGGWGRGCSSVALSLPGQEAISEPSDVKHLIACHLRKNVGWVKVQISKLALEEAVAAKQAEQDRIKKEQSDMAALFLDRDHTRVPLPHVLPHKPPQSPPNPMEPHQPSQAYHQVKPRCINQFNHLSHRTQPPHYISHMNRISNFNSLSNFNVSKHQAFQPSTISVTDVRYTR